MKKSRKLGKLGKEEEGRGKIAVGVDLHCIYKRHVFRTFLSSANGRSGETILTIGKGKIGMMDGRQMRRVRLERAGSERVERWGKGARKERNRTWAGFGWYKK